MTLVLTDLANDLITDLLPDVSRELEAMGNATITVAPGPEGGGVAMLELIVACPSPILGEALWAVSLAPAGAVFNRNTFQRLLMEACEVLREQRANLLASTTAGRT